MTAWGLELDVTLKFISIISEVSACAELVALWGIMGLVA